MVTVMVPRSPETSPRLTSGVSSPLPSFSRRLELDVREVELDARERLEVGGALQRLDEGLRRIGATAAGGRGRAWAAFACGAVAASRPGEVNSLSRGRRLQQADVGLQRLQPAAGASPRHLLERLLGAAVGGDGLAHCLFMRFPETGQGRAGTGAAQGGGVVGQALAEGDVLFKSPGFCPVHIAEFLVRPGRFDAGRVGPFAAGHGGRRLGLGRGPFQVRPGAVIQLGQRAGGRLLDLAQRGLDLFAELRDAGAGGAGFGGHGLLHVLEGLPGAVGVVEAVLGLLDPALGNGVLGLQDEPQLELSLRNLVFDPVGLPVEMEAVLECRVALGRPHVRRLAPQLAGFLAEAVGLSPVVTVLPFEILDRPVEGRHVLAVLAQLLAGGFTIVGERVLLSAGVDRLLGRRHGVQFQRRIDHAPHDPAPRPMIGLQAIGLDQIDRGQQAMGVAGQPGRRRPLPGLSVCRVGQLRDELVELLAEL
jgi:hypothetical protein